MYVSYNLKHTVIFGNRDAMPWKRRKEEGFPISFLSNGDRLVCDAKDGLGTVWSSYHT